MRVRTVVAAFIGLVALPAFAHHSYSMFDLTKDVTLVGTVTKFEWSNPHSHIYLNVVGTDGKETEWQIEAGSPNGMGRRGWKSTSLAPGEKVTLSGHPLRDGTNGASLVSVTKADGTILK
ncbi:MAG: DUF6152 family protein [Steroidobacteraceae bacterium]